jgi:hypothetical protein
MMSRRRETGWLLWGFSAGLVILGWIGSAHAARVDGAVESVRVEPGAIGENRIIAVIRNLGDAPLGRLQVNLGVTQVAVIFQSRIGQQTQEVEGPAPGQAKEVQFLYSFKDSGGYVVEVGINPPWDRYTLNNIASAEVYIEKTPPAVSPAAPSPPRRPAPSVSAPPRPAGQPVQRDVAIGGIAAEPKGSGEYRIGVTATNVGKVAVPRVDLELTLEREGPPRRVEGVQTRYLESLETGERRTVPFAYLCESPGSVAVHVRLLAEGDEDPGNDIARITILCP